MANDEVLKAVFPLLDGRDLASCMIVCKQWRGISQDDYLWKCLCAKRWPSVCKGPSSPSVTYQKIYKSFYRRHRCRSLPPPRLSFADLDFYIDIWDEDKLVFSEIIHGPVFLNGIKNPPQGVCNMLKLHLGATDYKMILPVEPRFAIAPGQVVSVSLLVGRKDSHKVACIINKSLFDYIDHSAYRALAFDYLDFSPGYPFVSGVRAWISLLFLEYGSDPVIDVFGIEMDFCDAASSEKEVLWLLDMLDWK